MMNPRYYHQFRYSIEHPDKRCLYVFVKYERARDAFERAVQQLMDLDRKFTCSVANLKIDFSEGGFAKFQSDDPHRFQGYEIHHFESESRHPTLFMQLRARLRAR